jgi:hypothetical protein
MRRWVKPSTSKRQPGRTKIVENDRNYELGYGRPPQKMRFRKGRSGNPTGRPRSLRTLSTRLEQALSEPVVVIEHGQRKTITKGEAMLKQLANKALAGDARVSHMLLAELRALEAGSELSGDDHREEVQEQIIMLERLTIEERLEFRRLLAKAQGDPQPGKEDESAAAVVGAPRSAESSSEQVQV